VYKTIALSKKVYSDLLNVKHTLEEMQNKSLSFNDTIEWLCDHWGNQ
jgi:predicted CopG family antitoxin